MTELSSGGARVEGCSCDSDRQGADEGCLDGAWHGWCSSEYCCGFCEYQGRCPCSCHEDDDDYAEDVVELKALVDGLRATLNEAIDRLVDYGESPDAWYAKAYEASHPTPPLCFRLIEDNGSFCGRTLPCPEHSDGAGNGN